MLQVATEILVDAFPYIVGGLIGFSGTWLQKYYDQKRHRREMIFKAAIEHWKKGTEFAMAQKGSVLPLEHYLMHWQKFEDTVINQELKGEDLKNELEDIKNEMNDLRKVWESQQ